MKTKLAKAISILLNPAFMPMLGVFIIFHSKIYQHINPQHQLYVYLIVFVFTILFPLSLFPLLSVWNLIGSIHLDERKDRFIPLFISTLSFYVTHFLILKMGGPRLLSLFTFAMSLTSLLVLLVTLFWKISIHMTGIGGLTGLILALSLSFQVDLFMILVLAIIVSGFLASVRLYLQVHTISQVAAGFFAGFLSVIGTYYFFSV